MIVGHWKYWHGLCQESGNSLWLKLSRDLPKTLIPTFPSSKFYLLSYFRNNLGASGSVKKVRTKMLYVSKLLNSVWFLFKFMTRYRFIWQFKINISHQIYFTCWLMTYDFFRTNFSEFLELPCSRAYPVFLSCNKKLVFATTDQNHQM